MNSFLDRASDRINRGVEYTLFGLGLAMALTVATQVFFRYVLNQSLFWSEELARFMLVWLTFLGTSVAYKRQAHPGVDILTRRLAPTLRKFVTIATHLLSLGFFLIMVVYGIQFAHFVRFQISPALTLPKWIILSIIPICGTILCVHGVTFLAAEFRRTSRDG
ncbi:hypothetical protein D3OALGA1CA_3132 [Olavius algarvensis associated proteobacterium Delta 3]|nr:hypothetical protein D3OALGA1CA_3132 [Olavius algarvensis associated proteobacterium Delta 3]CAB5159118.1 hypothetical protein D3OALGB2SA_5314 [Olavius algarvensis associated proteobacterium Delta 3]